jgi:glucose-6-phosphate isomerase
VVTKRDISQQAKCICGSLEPPPGSSLESVKADVLAHLQATARTVQPLAEMFAMNPNRSRDFTFDAVGLHIDASRQRINSELWAQLLEVAKAINLTAKFAEMTTGVAVNATEGRAALHTALRADASSSSEATWAALELERAMDCAQQLRTNPDIHAVVNIGIGGSDLGPAMATRALRTFCNGPIVRYVSNIDGADLDNALRDLQPRHTAFIVSSKTFTTSETMHNAARAREWMTRGGVSWTEHFFASTARPSVAMEWGINPKHCFEFKEWVGGRYSISSVIGLPLMCAIGADAFKDVLVGMREMDEHVGSSDVDQNLAAIHALVWIANAVVHEYPTIAVVPYSHDLARLPAYLQQLVMESNGKSVSLDGLSVSTSTSPVVWGEPGTNGQHAFFQMLHQGTQVVPVEFVGTVAPLGTDPVAHDILIANMLAQAEALAAGDTNENSHKNFPGNRPSTVIMLDELTPHSLGALLALYEHSTVFQGWILGVNSFDQFGVELGKTIAGSVLASMNDANTSSGLTLTHPLLDWYLQKRKNNSS